MKVLHIHFGKDGGAERFFVNLVDALGEKGVEQRVLIRPDRSWKTAIEKTAIVYEGVFRRISLSRFLLSWRLKRILKEFKPDVIMTWQLRASRFMPNVKTALRISRLGDYPEHLDYYRNSEVLVCITPDMADRVKRMGWTRRIEVVPNFSNATPVPPIARSALDTPQNAFVVVAMGRFVKRKGFAHLIRAIKEIDGAYLWLLGDGPEREELVKLVDELGLHERIKLPGWKTDAYAYLNAADVFAITSLHEPLGNVCFEGWGAGKPTVAFRAEGPSFVMTDQVDALMVDCGDEEGLRVAITRLRDDPDLRDTLIEGGYATTRSRFSKQAITASYMQLFEKAANK
ncbi:glycosyltransferase involved in cell wall biosynthesis [Rhizobium skierniewicense]|uniref:Glycosyltransferase involved in cell wall biosynthesis n=1 Tax=Rhizobium skierniewicense TaxID=984260 RepID=A0A7W6CBW2_9HYPH|nr:glycosyltransferase [Rhizobium skierniewicense]MBB3945660.1 glycosyltransferase involved in cell wall biosynthesis [Rhizobium skierniewicense]